MSGVLVGTSYIPFRGWFLLVCFIPLWLAVLPLSQREKPAYLKIFLSGWITQFILTLIGFNWIYYVSTEFGHLHWSLALGALLLFAGLMHIYIPISLLIASVLHKKLKIRSPFVVLLSFALLHSFMERIWPSIFEWNLAYTLLWIKWPLFQWADVVGFWGLSTWLLIFQALLAYAIVLYKKDRNQAALTAIGTLIAIAVLSLTGSLRAKSWKDNDHQLRMGIAQGNIGNAEKTQSEKGYQFHSYIRNVYTELTSKLLKESPADVVIWPETAMPFALDQYTFHRTEQSQLLSAIQSWNTPIITGGYSVSLTERDHLDEPMIRNTVFYLSTQGNMAALPYFKTNLLVFGEYMPFGEEFPYLYKLLPFVGVYGKGSDAQVANLTLGGHKVQLGPQICYDSLAPDFSRRLSLNGAEILFNVTNDAWFGWWAEPYQHGWMTLGRAIEIRRPLVRSTNTGISMTILADGTLLAQSPIGQSWTHTYDIPYKTHPPQTFYTLYGHYDWALWLLFLVGLLLWPKKGEHA